MATPDVDLDVQEPVTRRRRRSVTVVLLLPALVLLGVCVLRLGGIDTTNRIPIAALSITPYLAAAGLLLALISFALRRRVIAFGTLLLALSLAVLLVPRYLADGDDLPDGQHVRVMTVNLRLGGADPKSVVDLVRNSQVDVLTLQELTPSAVVALESAGITELLPHRVLRPAQGASGSGVMAKVPLRQIVLIEGTSFEQPAAVVDLSGQKDFVIVSVHVMPPVVSEGPGRWSTDLAALPGSDSNGLIRVLAGDFNATLDHAAFNHVRDKGYSDAAEVAGEGLRPTWSDPPLGPPVTIDHVLVDRRVGVASAAVYDLPGSDHNALWTELVLPR